MAGLKEPGTVGTSDCVVMFVHILIVGRQALVNHISILRFLSHVIFKTSTAPFYMYTGERDLTEVIRNTTPPGFCSHITDKRIKKGAVLALKNPWLKNLNIDIGLTKSCVPTSNICTHITTRSEVPDVPGSFKQSTYVRLQKHTTWAASYMELARRIQAKLTKMSKQRQQQWR